MKILIVASDFPWPKTQGGHLRLATAIEALAELGEVDLFAPYDYRQASPVLPASAPVNRFKPVARHGNSTQLRWRAAWLARRGLPLEVIMRRADGPSRLELQNWVEDSYDLVWIDRASTFEWMGRQRLGPTIIDFHDLEDTKARLRVQIMLAQWRRGKREWPHLALAAAQTRVNAWDWRHFQRSVARTVDRVVLSSDSDARRSGLPNVVVVPNTYERPREPAGHVAVNESPVVLFQATFDYAPNMDAVDWLMGDIAPLLRNRVPHIEFRLVGKAVPGVSRWHSPPAVTVVGVVPAMEPELARADIAVSPIRYGSGTRLKILESFAHRVPVVSTTMGADGLDVEDRVHLLIADDPEDFATDCERLLSDPGLRKRLADAAQELYLAAYESSLAREHIQALARAVAFGRAGRRNG